MIYCSYTDRDLPASQTSREHIIPLSLGGVDGFLEVLLDEALGLGVDGRVANLRAFPMHLEVQHPATGLSVLDSPAAVKGPRLLEATIQVVFADVSRGADSIPKASQAAR